MNARYIPGATATLVQAAIMTSGPTKAYVSRLCRLIPAVVFLSAALVVASHTAGAEVVLSDSFEDGNVTAAPAWTIDGGSVTVEQGEMSFGPVGQPAAVLDLGDLAPRKAVQVSFKLRQTNATRASHLIHIGLTNSDRNKGYEIACSPNPGYFATSGFYDSAGHTVGVKGSALRSDAQWQQITLRFDPVADRLSLIQDGKKVLETGNCRRLARVNRLRLASNGQVNWRVDDLRVEGVPAASQPQAKPGAAAIQTIYRRGVPHTDKTGRRLMAYDAGRSFFQIGIWGNPIGEIWGTYYDLRTLTDAGINTMWPWSAPLSESLAAADKAGLQVVWMHPLGPKELELLGPSRGHARLLGNCWLDEPTGSLWGKDMQGRFDEFLAYKKRIAQVAPDLPVFVNDVPWITPPATEWWTRWNTAGGVSCHDNYPVRDAGCVRTLGAIGETVSLAVEVNHERKPVWLIVGAFDEGRHEGPGFRFATPAQLRSCVYTGLVHGATGIVYFCWDTYVCRDGGVIGMSPKPKVAYVPNPQQAGYTHPTPATPVQLAQSRALWQTATAVNREIAELTPVLLAPTVAEEALSYQVFPDVSHSDQPIHCLLKPHPAGGYVLATSNLDGVGLRVTFRFSHALASAERMFENRPDWAVPGGSKTFEIWYEPFDVHVFRLRLQ